MAEPTSSAAGFWARHGAGIGIAMLLLLVLQWHLLAALLSALASYVTYRRLLQSLSTRVRSRWAGLIALVLTLGTFAVLALVGAELVHDVWTPHGGLPGLLRLLAETLDRLRTMLPPWIAQRLPASTTDLQAAGAEWLRDNAQELQKWGHDALRLAAHLLLGFVIGLLSAFGRGPRLPSWMAELRIAAEHLAGAFADVVSAQVRIAGANAVLTGIFVLVALPLAGIKLPLGMTLVLLTFVLGFLPIVGNLLSNTLIVLAALTVSPGVAIASLVFLIAIHKLEYFLNAHFVGQRTSVPAPFLLSAMLLLDAGFGVTGLVAAPIYCAWLLRQFASADTDA